MPKAILELEMPENCKECILKKWTGTSSLTLTCSATGNNGLSHKRPSNCPLKPVEKEGEA